MAINSIKNYILFSLVCVVIFSKCEAAAVTKSKDPNSLTDNYAVLLDDVHWFFQRVENFATTVERMLPNVTTSEKNRNFGSGTRINFLAGLRHLLVGVKEISTTFRQNFKTDHVHQLQQIKHITGFINNIIKILKSWFGNLRAMLAQIFQMYSYHMPEVLLGKCLGKYIVAAHPNRMFYEYPFLLAADLIDGLFVIYYEYMSRPTLSVDKEETTTHVTDDLLMAQNEIPYNELEDYRSSNIRANSPKNTALTDSVHPSDTTQDSESFFNLSDVLDVNKDAVIDSAVEMQSWQKCFKMYTAESILRKIKVFFFST